MNNKIKIFIVGEENLFNDNYIEGIKRYGEVIYKVYAGAYSGAVVFSLIILLHGFGISL